MQFVKSAKNIQIMFIVTLIAFCFFKALNDESKLFQRSSCGKKFSKVKENSFLFYFYEHILTYRSK